MPGLTEGTITFGWSGVNASHLDMFANPLGVKVVAHGQVVIRGPSSSRYHRMNLVLVDAVIVGHRWMKFVELRSQYDDVIRRVPLSLKGANLLEGSGEAAVG